MSRFMICRSIILVAGLMACDTPSGLPPAQLAQILPSSSVTPGPAPSTTGGGHYLLQGAFDTKFSFSAIQHPDGSVSGQFRQSVEDAGLVIDFHGRVTCVAVDPVTHRAWVGGVVTQNRSTDPSVMTDIHEPGDDVWFRVVDYGEGNDAPPDRTSFLGFEGAAGILTSAEYCVRRIWPDDDARTHAVTSGNIQVRP
jgi:hypothetical protein